MFAATFAAAFLAASGNPAPPEFLIEIQVYRGDPLGTPGDGTVKTLSCPKIVTRSGRPAFFRMGSAVEVAERPPATDGVIVLKKGLVPIGIEVETLVLPYLGGKKLYVETNTADRTVVFDGKEFRDYAEVTGRTSRIIAAGEPYRVRISAASSTDQTWAVVTVRPAR